jgi:esterase
MAVEVPFQNSLAADVRGLGPPLVLLHGLFASSANVRALANELSSTHTVHSLDLPLHGQSVEVPADSLESMAARVADYCRSCELADPVVIGHSLGGKVAMSVLATGLHCKALVVLDIAPVAYAPSHQVVFDALAAVSRLNLTSRGETRDVLARALNDKLTVEFLLTQLKRTSDGSVRWKFDWEALRSAYEALLKAPEVIEPVVTPGLFVAGERSGYVNSDGKVAIKTLFPKSAVVPLKGAGHWPHAEKLEELVGVIRYFLQSRVSD